MLLALVDPGAPLQAAGAAEIEEMIVRPGAGTDGSVVLSSSRAFVPPASLADLLTSTPDVALTGQGGRLQTFSVRGIGQERIRVLFNDAPLRGLRRAGVSAAFLDPEWMRAAIDARAAPVTQGSGAIGGTIFATPLEPFSGRMKLSFEGPGSHRVVSARGSTEALAGAFSYQAMHDQEAPDGTRLNTSFEQASTLLRASADAGPLHGTTTLLFSEGSDLGKSNSDFPDRVTNYPVDRHLFLSQGLQSDRWGSTTLWLHRQKLETKTMRNGVRTDVDTSTDDYGLRWHGSAVDSERTRIAVGFDVMGRANYEVEEEGLGTLRNGAELELGAYADGQHQIGRWQLILGGRLLYGRTDADGKSATDTWEPLGHVGIGWRQSPAFGWQASVHRAVTVPTVSQLFFSGTTARGGIVGNDTLDPETAWVYELGASGTAGTVRYSVSTVYMDIDSFIEKVPLDTDVDTFVNAQGGEVWGVTGEIAWPVGPLEVEAGGTALRGDTDGGDPMRDIPANRATLRVRWPLAGGTAAVAAEQRFKSTRVAAGNRVEDARTLLNASFRRAFGKRWEVVLFGRNLLDELYYVTGDEKSALAPERTLGISLAAAL
jgi:iron complex outermembrane receptor protein